MAGNDKLNRIRELTGILNDASKLYYQGDMQIMTDKEYDALLDELEKLEAETGYSQQDSPAKRVGHEVVSALVKVAHKSPMMSLDKTKDEGKMLEFIGGHESVISLKLDGLAVELAYEDGRLAQAVTRGNGQTGENVTHNARNFVNLPATIPFAGELRIRGEAVISFSDFEKINEKLEEKYKNPRNLCSGTVRQLDSAATKTRPVHYVAYSTADNECPGKSFTNKSEILDFLHSLGFETVKHYVATAGDFSGILQNFKDSLANSDFATDGLVVSYNDIAFSRSLGHTSKFPKDSLAFKWADEEAESALISVEWNTSRTGLINPVAVFAPVEIEGTTVERASLHNVSMFESFALGAGDRVLVYKANMIIPQIADNLTRSGTLSPPEFCPVCGSAAETVVNKDAKTLYCMNPNCTARAVQTIAHYASRDAMNIEGLSEQTIIKFHELGYLNTYADLYKLRDHRDELCKLKGFGEQSVNKLLSAIDKSAACFLHSFIGGLGIANVGREYAKSLCAHFNNDLERIKSAQPDELMLLHGFGEAIAQSLHAYFANPRNIEIMDAALPYLTFIEADEQGERRLEGKIFVITGELKAFSGRGALRELIEREGGRVASAVSGKTDYLINNDSASSSSKNKAAKELGVPIITEDEFNEFIK
ncbi:MAG: NAD-dependent DNA ligase LigA [Defluviitaleaceae bacterium]|nr:NAD-dependent DNA ligase LigA [Defluviitaleaceae bacterium]MCL2837311.1 NAD-dependent DNA ligase LigA [Defluviitaleaceae bacterium]